jgi:DNA-binding transcriptional regulator YhcF (GntR family)
MLLRVDFGSEQPLYQQLRDQIVEGIAAGALAPGERLPSVRQLAADLDINLQTANKAYALLQGEGFIKAHKREGFVVRARDELAASAEHRREITSKLRPICAEAVCRGMSEREFARFAAGVYAAVKNGGPAR